uniref:Prolyl 4-hydroxylase alpha subunit domain-containing protein n=1 Tax=Paramoeba aestuarina TaxID=180227 RepID=A0A7S4L0M6_9EUKA|mmetsp:Transcript_29411/g.45473  ORF Transcript_29411/g.45473 Transcript_29411/m.45473 type:complete len:231 (+) Transcript_29411:54-746(+)|eukprot:CAMPEP_0201522670 /NCGR_PEP_ID=MMETSP0161_2-20130828/18483_1 /ASSEMBLY_ACC=CAM_ASM_000251 /TAXON_ID=180227 /ORGANISM="Neoparamoeba aestuarina, Strain SoJaBio B1-5/56/2" /LENGTH=230 /DNA_ID=CAMNT_0047921583 /DNA_START=48 /DNA_END=740 /DNA_ORIENTATION=-
MARNGLSVGAEGPISQDFKFDSPAPTPVFHDLDIYDCRGQKLLAFTVDNVLSEDECQRLIDATEARGYAQALVNVGFGRQELMDDVRKSDRFMSDDKDFAKSLLDRLTGGELFPNSFKKHDVVCLNERLRFLRYYKGGFFAHHHDGCYIRPDGSERSYVTLQLYLNTPAKGGATTFFSVYTKDGKPIEKIAVNPRPGKVLIFQHNILHEGSLLEEGVKYAMRTDIMYKNK